MKQITTNRLKEMSQMGYESNITKTAETLINIIDNAYSEYQNDETYFIDTKETSIQVTTNYEEQECSLRGLSINYPELVKATFCINLHDAQIRNIDKLVREYYKEVM